MYMTSSSVGESDQNVSKKNAGYYAAELVRDGMVVGLGTGSTVFYAMERLAEKIRDGMNIVGIPTSYQAECRAREYGIPLATLHDYTELDIAIDGADQIDPKGFLIKGRGAAQTQERCVAAASRLFVVVADVSKQTPSLSAPVPVEVIPSAASLAAKMLSAMGGTPVVREGVKKDGPVITDNGNWIIDCTFAEIPDPLALETDINNIPGVLSCGIFAEFTEKSKIVIGKKESAEIMLF
ncbi:ribose-5-phosphate isomerase RpiA [Methanogenium organophilum]|uniref:Ribose-5-phosphate isomerase A n=1 Tax=Methanogenium organophilum TaxID=2199 RepID=A0A9X9S403_METOG|nr:ribose-5-phosphate isomerase RpiA [Methanogenium organophilum]WAI01261.1 ribose-5-phosphate isomerase RpiA [Methanogenium organophilum]